MKIAVIGAGIFGSTIAIKLADNGFDVDLYEKEKDILQAASGINQYRLHRGYHYPRSMETGESSRKAYPLFVEEYGEAVIDKNHHFYCVPKKDSKVSGAEFLKFCMESGLDHSKQELPHLKKELVDVTIKGQETLVNPDKLRQLVRNKIREARVNLILGKAVNAKEIEDYDQVVNCTYANINYILEDLPEARRAYQFEVCEKPVLRLPENFKKISTVIMDGPFFCIDPYGETDLHVMGNVVHAIHSSNTGLFPEIPEDLKPYLNKGVVKNPKYSRIDKFIESASYFMPEISKAEHIGSMYTVRTVLPRVDHTDERPTIVNKLNDKIINVFSGKLGNCVQAANQVLDFVKEKEGVSRVLIAR